MPFLDLLKLAFRNLREAKLRATLTSMGVIVGVAVIVTMVSFGLGLQRNLLSRFKALDLFSEMSVYGKTMSAALNRASQNRRGGDRPPGPRVPENEAPTRILDDAAIAEIAKIPGVLYVEPAVFFFVEIRVNGKTFGDDVAGCNVPNLSTRFKEFDAGQMISAPAADEAVVSFDFVRDAGFSSAAEAIGKNIEFLVPNEGKSEDVEDQPSFFGLPLGGDEPSLPKTGVAVAKTFRIAGVLKEVKPNGGPGPQRGFMPTASINIPVAAARQWSLAHTGEQNKVIMALARESGAIGDDETPGYLSAVVRVTDPVALADVRTKLKQMGLGSFSIVDQLDQIRTRSEEH